MIPDILKLGLDFTGTVTLPADETHPTPRKVVFQGASHQTANYWTKTGQPRKLRAHVIPLDPQTPSQLARRAHMRQGVIAWQALTAQEKKTWMIAAEKKGITGYNLFISDWLKSFVAEPSVSWDSGLSTWDSGNSIWQE